MLICSIYTYRTICTSSLCMFISIKRYYMITVTINLLVRACLAATTPICCEVAKRAVSISRSSEFCAVFFGRSSLVPECTVVLHRLTCYRSQENHSSRDLIQFLFSCKCAKITMYSELMWECGLHQAQGQDNKIGSFFGPALSFQSLMGPTEIWTSLFSHLPFWRYSGFWRAVCATYGALMSLAREAWKACCHFHPVCLRMITNSDVSSFFPAPSCLRAQSQELIQKNGKGRI